MSDISLFILLSFIIGFIAGFILACIWITSKSDPPVDKYPFDETNIYNDN